VTATQLWISRITLAGMLAGMLSALAELGVQARNGPWVQARNGPTGLALCAGLVVVAGGLLLSKKPVATRLLNSSPWAFLAICGVASTGTMEVLAVSLIWAILMSLSIFILGLLICGSTPFRVLTLPFTSGLIHPEENVHTQEKSSLLTLQTAEPFQVQTAVDLSPGRATGEPLLELFMEEEEYDDELPEGDSYANRDQPVQQWTRIQNHGTERLEGMLIAELQREQRHCYVHVPFIPFFRTRPAGYCECESDDPSAVTAELDLTHVYGARLSVRRQGDCSHAARVQIHLVFAAETTAARVA